MECSEARRLLARGIEPSSANRERTELGFHLSGCSACHAYRVRIRNQLLDALLQPIPAPSLSRTLIRRLRRHPIRYVGFGIGAIVLLMLLFVVGPAALALVSIRHNIQAMIVPTAAGRHPAVSRLPASSGLPHTQPGSVASAARLVTPTVPPIPTKVDAFHVSTAKGVITVAATAIVTSVAPSPVRASPTPITVANGQSPTRVYLTPTLTITPIPLGRVNAPSSQGAAPAVANKPPSGSAITVLLLGNDRRPDEKDPARTDAIMVARIEPDRHRIALLSLPRDLIVEIPGYGSDRINAASVYGDLYPELGGGTQLARRTVSNLLDIPIDYVVNVNFEGFVGAVDAIGGVDINVPTELYDPQYPTMDYRYMVAHFLPGPQHMDGATALIYSRIRHMDSDFQRMQRQQAVIIGLITHLRQENALAQLQSVAKITDALRGYIQTDLPEDRIVSLAWAFRNIAPESVEHYTLDGSQLAMNVVPGDPYAEIALPGAIQRLVQQLLGTGTR